MIEEIKEHLAEYYGYGTSLEFGGEFVEIPLLLISQWIQILGKYENQPDYKNAWDEIFEKSHYKNITMEDMIEFSKKYNLGGE